MYYTHPGCRTSIFDENRAYCIRDFTVIVTDIPSHAVSELLQLIVQILDNGF